MKAILIPVKLFRHSKRRLAPHFTQSARAALAQALCEDFFRMVAEVPNVERICVISQEPVALERARSAGWEIISETEQISESRSVDAASRVLAAEGVSACLRLPIDIPLTQPSDVTAILEQLESGPTAILVPSQDGTGTNALLRAPPGLFPSHFGPDSFALHCAEAERAGARLKIMHNPRVAIDTDDIDDLRAVASHIRQGSALSQWIAQNSLSSIGRMG